MADNGAFFKRILKIFAIIAVMIAMGLCALLVGCGSGGDTGNDGKENNDGGDIKLPPWTHYVSSAFESEYDADNFAIPMSYAYNHLHYPNYDSRFFKLTDYELCLFANKEYEYVENDKGSFQLLDSIQPGEINGSIYMIEKISFPKNADGFIDMEEIENTLASQFDLHYDCENKYWIYDHNINVTLPREFLNDSGTIYFDLKFIINFYEVPKWFGLTIDEYSCITGYTAATPKLNYSPQFDYSIEGDKVKLTNIDNGAHTIKPYDV